MIFLCVFCLEFFFLMFYFVLFCIMVVVGFEEVNLVSDFERKFVEIYILWDEIVLVYIYEWLNVYLKSYGILLELFLVGILLCISVLIGNIIVKLFDFFLEKGNLFMLGLVLFGVGKIFVCNIGCVRLLILYLEL